MQAQEAVAGRSSEFETARGAWSLVGSAETLDRLMRGCGHALRVQSTPLPSSWEEFSERFAGLAEPTADDVTRTTDGRELRTAEDVKGFIAELRSEGLPVR